MFKVLLEVALGLTAGGAVLFATVAVRRFRRFPAFWLALSTLVAGVFGTSLVLFLALLRTPVPPTARGVEYLVAQLVKATGLFGVVYVITNRLPESSELRRPKPGDKDHANP